MGRSKFKLLTLDQIARRDLQQLTYEDLLPFKERSMTVNQWSTERGFDLDEKQVLALENVLIAGAELDQSAVVTHAEIGPDAVFIFEPERIDDAARIACNSAQINRSLLRRVLEGQAAMYGSTRPCSTIWEFMPSKRFNALGADLFDSATRSKPRVSRVVFRTFPGSRAQIPVSVSPLLRLTCSNLAAILYRRDARYRFCPGSYGDSCARNEGLPPPLHYSNNAIVQLRRQP